MNVTTSTVTTTLATALALFSAGPGLHATAQEASPTPSVSCSSMPPTSAMTGMMMGTPIAGAGHDMAVEFDQMYIDMMLPHHASIIALAQAAQERLTDERLQAIAGNIITSQSAENEELRGYREAWYGSGRADADGRGHDGHDDGDDARHGGRGRDAVADGPAHPRGSILRR